ncbi:MAG: DUF1772 domain-containing protein [Nakamurella sp.]
MPASLIFLLTAAAGYAGFQWTVHVLVYRQFSAVPTSAFAEYERLHQRRVSFVVGPLFAALVGAAGWLLADRPPSLSWLVAALPAVLVAVILILTGLLAVPLHRRLSARWDGSAYRSLLRVDLCRTLVASVNLLLVVTLALRVS